MDARTIEAILNSHPFFDGMKNIYISSLAECASNARFEARKTIYRQGEAADCFYIIEEGKVAVETDTPDRGVITIQTLGKGDMLGWSWLFPPYVWHFDARTVEPTDMIAMDARCLRGKCEADPGMGYDFMKRFSALFLRRFQETRLQIMDIYGAGPKSGS